MEDLSLSVLDERFQDAKAAATYLESIRWPNGPVCPHCGESERKPYPLKSTTRKLYKCAGCRKQYTVTVGTIFEGSHIPLNKWLLAFNLLCASKKGMSAHQLHRMLDVTYKSAWFMAHRIRYAMTQPPFQTRLKRGVEAVYHHVSEAHLPRYLAEFDFRYNTRTKVGYTDGQRTRLALSMVEGKRLRYAD